MTAKREPSQKLKLRLNRELKGSDSDSNDSDEEAKAKAKAKPKAATAINGMQCTICLESDGDVYNKGSAQYPCYRHQSCHNALARLVGAAVTPGA